MVSSERSMTWAWIVLVAIAIGSWWLAPAHARGVATPSTVVTCVVLTSAFIKSRLIIRYFMEVRSAPGWLKLTTDAWLGLLFTTTFVIYLV